MAAPDERELSAEQTEKLLQFQVLARSTADGGAWVNGRKPTTPARSLSNSSLGEFLAFRERREQLGHSLVLAVGWQRGHVRRARLYGMVALRKRAGFPLET